MSEERITVECKCDRLLLFLILLVLIGILILEINCLCGIPIVFKRPVERIPAPGEQPGVQPVTRPPELWVHASPGL